MAANKAQKCKGEKSTQLAEWKTAGDSSQGDPSQEIFLLPVHFLMVLARSSFLTFEYLALKKKNAFQAGSGGANCA